jgi:hypothetical protein
MLIIGSYFPYRFPFPGVMFSLDRLEKKIIQAALKYRGAAPSWLGPLASAESICECKSLKLEHDSGMTLTGRPDEVFYMTDGTLGLVDYKSARFRDSDDPLFPKYAVQLGAYTVLLEEKHKLTVSEAGLLYFQAEADAEGEDLLDDLTDAGLKVEFSAHWLPVEIDREQVSELLNEAHNLATTNAPPQSADGCKDCERLTRISNLLEGIIEPLADTKELAFIPQRDRLKLAARNGWRRHQLETVIRDVQELLDEARNDSPTSVIGLWDVSDDAL